MRSVAALPFGLVLTALAASQAPAATATGSFNVQVVIQETCQVSSPSTTTLNFGTQTLLNANVDNQVDIQVQCTSGTDYDVSLDQGQNASRRMRQGTTSNYVSYQLYENSTRSTVWRTAAQTAPYTYIANGSAQNVTIYGRIPVQATPPAATYTDVVGITVTY